MAKAGGNKTITKEDLETSLKSFGKNLAEEIVGDIRQELDSKLTAMKVEFREDLSDQSLELTQAMSDMVKPMQQVDTDHELRITQLEHKAA
jgi:Ca2+-binding EF-hand superfamily protein